MPLLNGIQPKRHEPLATVLQVGQQRVVHTGQVTHGHGHGRLGGDSRCRYVDWQILQPGCIRRRSAD